MLRILLGTIAALALLPIAGASYKAIASSSDSRNASERAGGIANEAAAIDPNATFDIDRIEAPALVLHARDDRLNQVAISEDLAARITNANLIAYNSGGHLMLGHHQELREHTAAFLHQCAAG